MTRRSVAGSACLLVGGIATMAMKPIDSGELIRLSMAPTRSALQGDDRIGLKRSGLICGPAGALSWRDLAVDGQGLTARASTRLRAGGVHLGVADPDRLDGGVPPSRMRIVATIDRVAMRTCSPWRRIELRGAQGPVTASGRLAVTWRVFDIAGNSLFAKLYSCRDFSVEGAATLRSAFEDAFAQSAEAIVSVIDSHIASGRSGETLAVPAGSVCAAGEAPTA